MSETVETVEPVTTIAEYSETAAALATLAQKYKGVVFEVSSTAGMADAIKGRAELRGYRVNLEKTRKLIKEPALDHCRKIDTEAKRITAELEALECPIDDQIKMEESRKEREKAEKIEAEKRRVLGLLEKIADIRRFAGKCAGQSSVAIREAITVVSSLSIDADHFQEYVEDAQVALAGTLDAMEAAFNGALAQEDEARKIIAERAELEELRARAAAQQKIIDAQNAAEQKRLDDEKAAQDKLIAEENERIAAERLAHEQKMAAEQAELDRVAAEAEVARKAEQDEKERIAHGERLMKEAEERRLAVIAAAKAVEAEKARKIAEREKKLALAKLTDATAALKKILAICHGKTQSADEMLAAIELVAEANIV